MHNRRINRIAKYLSKNQLYKEAYELEKLIKLSSDFIEIDGDTQYKYKDNGDGTFTPYNKSTGDRIPARMTKQQMLTAAKDDPVATSKINGDRAVNGVGWPIPDPMDVLRGVGGYLQDTIYGETNPSTIYSLRFDGKKLYVESGESYSVSASSGLAPNNHKNPDGKDYRDPKYVTVANRGPIPPGSYVLYPSEIESSGLAPAWGGYRVLLHGYMASYLPDPAERAFEGLKGDMGIRGEFFLHGDGGQDGTAGCIGITNPASTKRVFEQLKKNTGSINVTVSY